MVLVECCLHGRSYRVQLLLNIFDHEFAFGLQRSMLSVSDDAVAFYTQGDHLAGDIGTRDVSFRLEDVGIRGWLKHCFVECVLHDDWV